MRRERIAERLDGLATAGTLTTFSSVASTNEAARTAARQGAAHGAAFVADAQTRGRGRGDHRWHSPPGENIYLSVVLRPAASSAAMAALTLAVGVGVAEVADAWLVKPRAMIKWPNDIYIDDRKVAGILVEATLQGDRAPVIVVGVGLNVLTENFPDALHARATSLTLAGGERLDRDHIAAELIASIRRDGDQFAGAGILPRLSELRRRDYLRGKRVCVGDSRGTVMGIDDTGRLLVGVQPVASGEVAILEV